VHSAQQRVVVGHQRVKVARVKALHGNGDR
jgi:hypothetical protein